MTQCSIVKIWGDTLGWRRWILEHELVLGHCGCGHVTNHSLRRLWINHPARMGHRDSDPRNLAKPKGEAQSSTLHAGLQEKVSHTMGQRSTCSCTTTSKDAAELPTRATDACTPCCSVKDNEDGGRGGGGGDGRRVEPPPLSSAMRKSGIRMTPRRGPW